MFWQKKPKYPNLYREIANLPVSAAQTGLKYPPAASGIEVKSLKEILTPHKELLRRIDFTTETGGIFEKRYWSAIERYAQTVHLLPASDSNHHWGVGGLLHHGLEVGLYAMGSGRGGLYGKDMGINKRDGRERWLFACFIAGLCHDLGKVASDVRVTSETGSVWEPHIAKLTEWAAKNRITKYYVAWRANRDKLHEKYTSGMLGQVLPAEDKKFIGAIDKQVLDELVLALNGSLKDDQSNRPYNIGALVQQADRQSVKEDKKRSRTPADFGIEREKSQIRHYLDSMRRMFQEGKWQINQTGGPAWVLGPDHDLYLVWPRCGMDLYDMLLADGVEGCPANPETVTEILADHDVIVAGPDGGYEWRIKPGDLEGAPLTVLRLRTDWGRHFVDLLPPGLSCLVESDGGTSSSWTYVEAGGPENSSGKIIPLHPNPETVMEEAKLDHVKGDHVPDKPAPEAGKAPEELPIGRTAMPIPSVQPVETEIPIAKDAWRRTLIHVVFGACLGSLGNIALLLYIFKHNNPDVSYATAFWGMMSNAFDAGWFVITLLLALMSMVVMAWYSLSTKDLERNKKKAAEILQEAQEVLDNAKQEAVDIEADARKEGGEIKKTAKEEGVDIRVTAKEEAAQIREQAKQEAEREKQDAQQKAAEVMTQAKNKAKETMDEFWLLLQAKARDMGISSEELQGLVKVLQKAKEEAAAIMAQAQAKAQEAAEEINVQAQEKAGKIIDQAQEEAGEIIDQAKTKSQEVLHRARVEAADILLMQAGQQSQEDQHGQEDSPEEDASPEDIEDLGQETDQVAALEERILRMLAGQPEMKKRDLERRGSKHRYDLFWESAINNLLSGGKIVYDGDTMTYRCQHE